MYRFAQLVLLLALFVGLVAPARGVLAQSDQSLFTTQTPATEGDAAPDGLELGMKFQVAVSGQITAIRYYRTTSETTMTHIGHIWSSTGTLLASVTFTGESTSGGVGGWQSMSLASPLAIAAGTTYIVSVNSLYYAYTSGGLASSIVNGDISSVADGANGVYSVTLGAFPTSTGSNANYFRDVVFQAGTATPTPTASATATPIATDTPTPAGTPPPTDTPTTMPTATATVTPGPITPTITAIPTVVLGLTGVLSTTGQLAIEQQNAWYPSADTGPLFWSLMALVLVLWLVILTRHLWYRRGGF